MKIHIRRWGKGLGLRIPRAFAEESKIDRNSVVELTMADGSLIIRPIPNAKPALDQLLKDVTTENLHGEVETGPAVGSEAW